MEVAAIVSGINPTITATIDSVEMGSLQQVTYCFPFILVFVSFYAPAI